MNRYEIHHVLPIILIRLVEFRTMANTVDSRVGSQFSSIADFRARLALFEKGVYANYAIETSQKLKVSQNITQNDVDTFYYESARLQCKFAGAPRALVDEQNRQRETTTFKQGCTAFFRLKFQKKNGIPRLTITVMSNDHTHTLSAPLFETMPKQRQNTMVELEPFLEHAVNIGASAQLVQAEISTSSSVGGVVKRSDWNNYKAKKGTDLVKTDELTKVIAEMQKINGSRVKVRLKLFDEKTQTKPLLNNCDKCTFHRNVNRLA